MAAIPLHWGQIISPGKTAELDFPHDCSLFVTNICCAKYPDTEKGKKVNVIAHVKTIDTNLDADENTFIENSSIIASFIIGKKEFVNTDFVFSPLNTVSIKVDGNVEVHLQGYLDILDDGEEEEMIEEEEQKEKV